MTYPSDLEAKFQAAFESIIDDLNNQPEPTDLEKARTAFMSAPPAETAKPSLTFPAPKPGKTFKTRRQGRMLVYISLYADGNRVRSFYNTKELTALRSVKRLLGLGYALTEDGAKVVSPLCTY